MKISHFVQVDPVMKPNFDVTALNVLKVVGNATESMTVMTKQMNKVVGIVSYLRLTLNMYLNIILYSMLFGHLYNIFLHLKYSHVQWRK